MIKATNTLTKFMIEQIHQIVDPLKSAIQRVYDEYGTDKLLDLFGGKRFVQYDTQKGILGIRVFVGILDPEDVKAKVYPIITVSEEDLANVLKDEKTSAFEASIRVILSRLKRFVKDMMDRIDEAVLEEEEIMDLRLRQVLTNVLKEKRNDQ